MTPTLQAKAQEVANRLASNSTLTSDAAAAPAVIAAIGAVIVQVLQALSACMIAVPKPTPVTPVMLAARARSPKPLDRWRVRRLARENLRAHPQLNEHAIPVADAVMESGKVVTDVQMAALMDEIKE